MGKDERRWSKEENIWVDRKQVDRVSVRTQLGTDLI